MIKKKYHLTISANELTWKFDRPTIFLGEWCRLNNRKQVWEKMDAIVAKPYGLEAWKRDEDFKKVKKFEEKIFPKFCDLLNNHHNTKHSERFWWIILGHWFEIIVRLIFKNINMIKNCLESYEISETTIYKNDNYVLTTKDYISSRQALNDKDWNDCLLSKIINLLQPKNLNIEVIDEKKLSKIYTCFEMKNSKSNLSLKEKILKYSHQGYSFLANKFVKDTDAFIISPYLPLKEEIKLEIALGQFPQLWKRFKPEINVKANYALRNDLTKKLSIKTDDDVEKILSLLIFELLPMIYLEGFDNLEKITQQQPWPKTPKFIFTSNNFNTDEVFKLWAATKIKNGAKYYIGQHGNSYYTLKNVFPRVEEKTSDKFFTWGWTNGTSKFKPAFIFISAGKKEKNYNKNGGLLHLGKPPFALKSTWDVFSELENYFKDQKEFISHLSPNIKKKLLVKLHPKFQNEFFQEDLKWIEFDPNLKIETKKVSVDYLISESRLVLHAYDSTGVLDTLSRNIPTIAFWQNGFDHLRKKIIPDYQMLVDAGIVHLSAQSAANKINETWNDVEGWWNQNDTQEIRKIFCDKYAKNCTYPAREMASLLKEK